ncbi:MAG: UvrD-helicase domain-containing protein [Candidatus Scalindua sp.]
MPVEINITYKDIVYAENVLLAEGQHFDDERKDFIKNIDTIDLQAVPGSGKTTVLLAKLLILEKHLPFYNSSGILVISHTNAAIDEIKNKIELFCPKLFSYPNFVGTIQSFVDEFLAIPYYLNRFKKKPYRIDDEIYDEKIKNYYNNMPSSRAKSWLDRKNDPLSFLKYMRFDTELNLIEGINGKISLKRENNSTTFKVFKKMKDNLLEWGYLHFDDAYFLANIYIKEFPKIKTLLQKRFRYVFVDEMQDMDKHQYDLLEEIFFDEGNSISNYQRIGDKNQAIFNGSAKLDDIWKDRDTILKLKGSYRLTEEVANIVKHFGLGFVDIEGRFLNSSGSNIKPHIFVFDDNTITNVIPEFAKLVNNLKAEQKLPDNPKSSYKSIAWRKEKLNNGKLGLQNYLDKFNEDEHRPKEDYSCLESYLLHYDKNKKTLESVRKSILNALLRILRYENILDDNNRNYTKKKMLFLLKENNEEQYENLKSLLYQWSINIIRGKKDDVYSELRGYLSELLDIFEKSIHKSKEFIETPATNEHVTGEHVKSKNGNIYEKDGIKIEITTIHAVKGQTHTGTLYLETFYQRKHESNRLLEQFKGNNFNKTVTYDKQSTKMAYVGLSRPTHLLCMAIHKDRFNEVDFKDKWEIINITENVLNVVH